MSYISKMTKLLEHTYKPFNAAV